MGNIAVESQAATTSPSISNIAKGVALNGTLAFAAADFAGAYTDPGNNSLQKIIITSLPQHGTVKVGGTAVALNQEIPAASLGTLSYVPASNYIGLDSFGWNASDGIMYAVGAAAVNLTVNAAWTPTGGGTFSWGSSGNWQNGVVPGVAGSAALLGATVGSSTATITLSALESLSSLTFSPATGGSYALSASGANSLQLANSGSPALITITNSTSAINAPVVLGDNVNVAAASGTSMVISGNISQTGGSHGVTVSGSGKLTLSGINTYTGGTFVTGGTLLVTASSALPSGGALTVGAGATFIFDPSVQATPSAVMAATNAAIADSEDTTAAPSSTSPASSSLELLVPTVADVSAAGSLATPSSVSFSDSAGATLVQSSTTVVTSPVALPLPASAAGPQTNNLRKSIPAGFAGTPAAERVVWSSIARRAAGDLASLGQTANRSDNSDQQRKKDVAILALDTVFAEYGR